MCTAAERAIPTISAPIAAPGMLPSPPMMTTAKETITTATETPGCTEIIGAVSAPPSDARKIPVANASV